MTTQDASLPPPRPTIGPVGWLRQNLFSTWYNALLTIALVALLVPLVALILRWILTEARWGVVTANLRLFLIGQYPFDEAWRIWLSLAILSVLTGFSAGIYGGATVRTLATWLAAGQVMLGALAAVSGLGPATTIALVANAAIVWAGFLAVRWRPRAIPRRLVGLAWLASMPMTVVLLQGIRGLPLPIVTSNLWGGLLLTFLLAIVGILLSFPFGVLLALGRRSGLPAVRILSTAYIELIRGVPLVTILFMAAVMLPLFLPSNVRIDQVLRAMVGITLFSAAYVAENVRGGLQAIPLGQVEAAHAIGLNTFQTNRFIVLPQALRAVIPANVGLFISLLKDTTLVTIVGLLELLGIGRAVLAQPQWFGAQLEVYVFIAAVFFILCYTMSQASYRLETALGVGTR
jgi:general L-amino acid transport system permease protein